MVHNRDFQSAAIGKVRNAAIRLPATAFPDFVSAGTGVHEAIDE
jgi:hypothetical protein